MYVYYNEYNMSGIINAPRLYSTVRVSLMEKDSDEVAEALYDKAAQYCDDVASAIVQFQNEEYQTNDLMQYFELPDYKQMEEMIKQKVKTAFLTTQSRRDTLFAVLELDLTEDLTVEELEVFAKQIEHQYMNGWGGDFEVQNILTSTSDVIALRLWHDELVFYTGEVFENKYGPQDQAEQLKNEYIAMN